MLHRKRLVGLRYGILFLVSVGNIGRRLQVDEFDDRTELEDANPEDRERAVLSALSEQRALRTLLSPAEALNPVTVGAMHDDDVGGPRGAADADPDAMREIPNVSSALGLGHRKVVKPDIYLPGGREHLRFRAHRGVVGVALGPGGRSGLRRPHPMGPEILTVPG